MIHRRSLLGVVEPAHRALAEGQYDEAFVLLEGAARRERRRLSQAKLHLYLAALYALYGEDGLEGGLFCLQEAAEIDPRIAETPLYRALYWEFAAHQGEAATEVTRGASAAADAGDAFARLHAASALTLVSSYEQAQQILGEIDAAALPDYLVWRRWSLLAQTYEADGAWLEAATAYEQAVAHSHERDQQGERLSLATCWLEVGAPWLALEALEALRDELLADDVERALYRYLLGRIHLQLGNPQQSLNDLHLAWHLGRDHLPEDLRYDVRFALAQTYGALGRFREAKDSYAAALQDAPHEQRALTRHEYAYTLVELGDLIAARDALRDVLRDGEYAFRGDACADLADVTLRLGYPDDARALAEQALELGADANASLCLANISFELFRFDDAEMWLERTISASTPGDEFWLAASQLLVDVLLQRGDAEPSRIIRHAEGVLEHLHPSDENALVLRHHVARAQDRLGGAKRWLS